MYDDDWSALETLAAENKMSRPLRGCSLDARTLRLLPLPPSGARPRARVCDAYSDSDSAPADDLDWVTPRNACVPTKLVAAGMAMVAAVVVVLRARH